ncbi:MAG: hypothetical protein L0H63_01335, partial [Nitrococcus sp.]|nr:hypothetical protein [Nitrococcus sp.]
LVTLPPRQALDHIHRLQQRLVEPGLVLIRDQEHPVVLALEGLGSSNEVLVLNFGVAVKPKKLKLGCRARAASISPTCRCSPSPRRRPRL